MKSLTYLIIIVILVLFTSFIQGVSTQPLNHTVLDSGRDTVLNAVRNEAPDYCFYLAPIRIGSSWYDYFPGGTSSIPIRMQPCPVGIHPGGGVYTAFQGITSYGGLRRVYYSYIEDGVILTGPSLINLIGTNSELSVSIDVDHETGVPFVTWCSPEGCFLSFDHYDMIGVPGLWITPYQIQPEGYRPEVFIGASPNQDQRRLYIWGFGTNNVILTYTDFTEPTDLENYSPDDWVTVTVPYLNNWYNDHIKIYAAPIVSRNSGRIAIVGHTEYMNSSYPYHSFNVLFVLENNHYGEGTWSLYTGNSTLPVENPQDYFLDDNLQPYQDMRYRAYQNRHNTIIDDEGNYHFGCIFALFAEDNSWFPEMTTSKHVKFSRETEEFILQDLYPREYSGLSYLPWSIPPEYDNYGDLIYSESWPCYWPDTENLYHENYHRMIEQEGRLIILFQTSSEQTMPDTRIMLSNNYGESWSYPVVLNSFDTPELVDMIPTYWYIADCMEYLGDDWFRTHLFFFDQNDYGSYWIGNGPDTGGYLCYTSIDFKFDYESSPDPPSTGIDNDLLLNHNISLQQNYPNPFNPETTIRYYLNSESYIRLKIYNIKGQLVRTLVDDREPVGEHITIWNGLDDSNQEVANGIYFYLLQGENESLTKKMLFMK